MRVVTLVCCLAGALVACTESTSFVQPAPSEPLLAKGGGGPSNASASFWLPSCHRRRFGFAGTACSRAPAFLSTRMASAASQRPSSPQIRAWMRSCRRTTIRRVTESAPASAPPPSRATSRSIMAMEWNPIPSPSTCTTWARRRHPTAIPRHRVPGHLSLRQAAIRRARGRRYGLGDQGQRHQLAHLLPGRRGHDRVVRSDLRQRLVFRNDRRLHRHDALTSV